jgi:sulfane dehydrogenase subunit SoxC
MTWPRYAAVTDDTPAAGGGLLTRRAFLKGAAVLGAGVAVSAEAADAHLTGALPSQKTPGRPFSGYGQPSSFEKDVQRIILASQGTGAPGFGQSCTPLHLLRGTITPSGLHFERHHHGVADIDPKQHRLFLHGLVKQPLKFTVDRLMRYPMVTRTLFLECARNSSRNTLPEPAQATCGEIHGLVSCSEWTGVPLGLLIEETGLDPKAKWIVAQGADAASLLRSIPIDPAMDDAIVALWQNGERLRPEQGYPMRLVLPGFESCIGVKWLHRIKVTDAPAYSREDVAEGADLLPEGKSRLFQFAMGVKSVITQPSPGWSLRGRGFYEIAGLAWSGSDRIAKVEISADGGKTWAPAELQEPVISKSFTRFRLAWNWNGASTMLMSRATDQRGQMQPTRSAWLQQYGAGHRRHYNAVQAWQVDSDGTLRNVYA